MDNNKKHVLVTGGGGYVGAVLVPKLLRAGCRVTVIDWFVFGDDIFGDHADHTDLNVVKGDIRDSKLLSSVVQNVDIIMHLACISNDPSFELDPQMGKSINYDATTSLVDLAIARGVPRFVYASSSSVYGIKQEAEVTEELPLEPLTDYSKYKALSEEYILSKTEKHFIPLILRPATVCGYSPRMRLDLTVNILTIHALIHKKITVFGGSQTRPNIHIDDMTDLYVKTITYEDEQINRKIFNAGYENHAVMDIAQMVKGVLADESIQINVESTDDLRSYRINSDKIQKELGFTPTHTIEDAIRDIKKAYDSGMLPDAFTNDRYSNIKTMKRIGDPWVKGQ